MKLSPLAVWQWRELKTLDRALLLLSIFCGASYLLAPFLVAEQIHSYWIIKAIIKGLAVSPLAIIAFRLLPNLTGKLLGSALVCSSIGDVFLALRNGDYFAFGLLSFLVAHLFFITLWVRNWSKPMQTNTAQKLLLTVLIAFLAVMLWWLLPVPNDLSIPVTIYMCVLTTMVITAALANFKTAWIISGTSLFMLSDSIIALSTFKNVVGGKLAGFLIWSTYYLAEYFIAIGFFSEKKVSEQNRAD